MTTHITIKAREKFNDTIMQPIRDKALGDAILADDPIMVKVAVLFTEAGVNNKFTAHGKYPKNLEERSLLEAAVRLSGLETISALLELKADCKDANFDIVEKFIERQDFGVNKSSFESNVEMLEMLHKHGADFKILSRKPVPYNVQANGMRLSMHDDFYVVKKVRDKFKDTTLAERMEIKMSIFESAKEKFTDCSDIESTLTYYKAMLPIVKKLADPSKPVLKLKI